MCILAFVVLETTIRSPLLQILELLSVFPCSSAESPLRCQIPHVSLPCFLLLESLAFLGRGGGVSLSHLNAFLSRRLPEGVKWGAVPWAGIRRLPAQNSRRSHRTAGLNFLDINGVVLA